MNADEYLKSRLDNQIDWYDQKSVSSQRWYKRLRVSEFVLAAFIPLLAGLITTHWSVQVIVGLVGVTIAIITASLGLYQFEQHWIEYRALCESLRKEKYVFLTRTAPYNKSEEDNLALLVQRVETLVSKENTNWAQSIIKSPEKTTNG
jgi:hypothetical protein